MIQHQDGSKQIGLRFIFSTTVMDVVVSDGYARLLIDSFINNVYSDTDKTNVVGLISFQSWCVKMSTVCAIHTFEIQKQAETILPGQVPVHLSGNLDWWRSNK